MNPKLIVFLLIAIIIISVLFYFNFLSYHPRPLPDLSKIGIINGNYSASINPYCTNTSTNAGQIFYCTQQLMRINSNDSIPDDISVYYRAFTDDNDARSYFQQFVQLSNLESQSGYPWVVKQPINTTFSPAPPLPKLNALGPYVPMSVFSIAGRGVVEIDGSSKVSNIIVNNLDGTLAYNSSILDSWEAYLTRVATLSINFTK
ncbi:MAG: hypothetical protein KGH52_00370 [Candidatus Micrarchaeota archaeon]|nr:hypothetical protein [Candidatus Micrarchaeota archaeon]